ncbi:putative VWFA domain-containing protein [Seiridium cardinale]|uniref:VWFA domain-containing protein n=1 Tax=Seiridium cardinale TaxID=138064 RepID=A0ABR2XR78_9PEZI
MAVKYMLDQLPRRKKSTFNIYSFDTSASSILPGGRSLGYDTRNLGDAVTAIDLLKVKPYRGTKINAALTAVLAVRDTTKPCYSIIVITDGLDWSVATAIQTIQ